MEAEVEVLVARKGTWFFVSCFFVTVATILGTGQWDSCVCHAIFCRRCSHLPGILGLPVELSSSGFWPFVTLFTPCLLAQGAVVVFMIELLQYGQSKHRSALPAQPDGDAIPLTEIQSTHGGSVELVDTGRSTPSSTRDEETEALTTDAPSDMDLATDLGSSDDLRDVKLHGEPQPGPPGTNRQSLAFGPDLHYLGKLCLWTKSHTRALLYRSRAWNRSGILAPIPPPPLRHERATALCGHPQQLRACWTTGRRRQRAHIRSDSRCRLLGPSFRPQQQTSRPCSSFPSRS